VTVTAANGCTATASQVVDGQYGLTAGITVTGSTTFVQVDAKARPQVAVPTHGAQALRQRLSARPRQGRYSDSDRSEWLYRHCQ
jgi:hypothetical protein